MNVQCCAAGRPHPSVHAAERVILAPQTTIRTELSIAGKAYILHADATKLHSISSRVTAASTCGTINVLQCLRAAGAAVRAWRVR
jgi:hypothetical protein